MVSSSLARRLATRFGMSIDEAADVFRGVDDAKAQQVLNEGLTTRQIGVATLADQPSRATGRVAEAGSEAVSKSALFVGGGAGALGAGLAGQEFLKNERQERRIAATDERIDEAIAALRDPSIPTEQKRSIAETLARLLGRSPGTPGGGGGGGGIPILGDLLDDGLFSLQGLVVLIFAYFTAKAIAEWAGSGSAPSMPGGGS